MKFKQALNTIKIFVVFAVGLSSMLSLSVKAQKANTADIKLVNIKSGYFLMGAAGYRENYDEKPSHKVTISKAFKISATEITNRQYELFDPEHKKLRGKAGLSKEDDEAVIFVNYLEATAFCKWLSAKDKTNYRLPTEAEWEYACKAGSNTAYNMGDKLPLSYQKNQETSWTPKPVSLKVAQMPPNAWGVYDMHGNVEEWCYDWYGPYTNSAQADPPGLTSGIFRVTRGGSHGTPVRYLRSANRMGMIPQDKSWLVGFRIVQANEPATPKTVAAAAPANQLNVRQTYAKWVKHDAALFMTPLPYVHEPDCNIAEPFYAHNHCPAVTWCANGDLLAVWFSTDDEAGREMAIWASRLRFGNTEWDKPSLFFKVPDRNMTGSSLLNDKQGNLYYMNGVEAAGSWQNLAMVLRTSKDNGKTWSAPKMADAEHTLRNQVIAGMLMTQNGTLIQAGDATPGSEGGTAVHISHDKGLIWANPYTGQAVPNYKEGKTGGLIAGIHASIVELGNGNLMAMGRGNNIEGKNNVGLRMPVSISKDTGKTWTYHASEFPPVAGGQRLNLIRLNEGALLLISFTHHPEEADTTKHGMLFINAQGKPFKGYGLFAALSFDDGRTWPVKKLMTDGLSRFYNGGAWTGFFEMNATQAEPRGYMAITQTPDNIIHLLSSGVHYRFNLNWLKQPSPAK